MFRILIIALILTPSILAQSKIGTSAAPFLDLPPSVRAVGMGGAGVTLTDDRSYFLNPGSLGLLDCPRLQLTGSPLATEYPGGVHHYSYSIAGKVLNADSDSRLSLAVAYHFIRLTTPEITEVIYGDGPVHTFSYTANLHEVSVGAAYSGAIECGVGGTIGFISESASGFNSDGVTYDVGILARVHLGRLLASDDSASLLNRLRLDLGIAGNNLGPDVKLGMGKYQQPIEKRGGIGVNAEFGPLRLYPAIQLTYQTHDITRTHLGFEAELKQAIVGRIGVYGGDDRREQDRTAYGVTVKTKGLYEWLTGKAWSAPLYLNVSYAWIEGVMAGLPGTDYYGLELNL